MIVFVFLILKKKVKIKDESQICSWNFIQIERAQRLEVCIFFFNGCLENQYFYSIFSVKTDSTSGFSHLPGNEYKIMRLHCFSLFSKLCWKNNAQLFLCNINLLLCATIAALTFRSDCSIRLNKPKSLFTLPYFSLIIIKVWYKTAILT